jgi:peroxiredoxin Q/BCP
VEKHFTFRDKYNLGVPLASDPDHAVIDAYGLWQLKKLWGVEYMGVKRATIVVDAEGKVAAVLYATRIKGHAAKVLESVRAISPAVTRGGRSRSKA